MERDLGRLRRNSERFHSIAQIAPYLTPRQTEILMKASVAMYARETVGDLVEKQLNPERIKRSLSQKPEHPEPKSKKSLKERIFEVVFPREYSVLDKEMSFDKPQDK